MKASQCNITHPIPAHVRQLINTIASEYRGQGLPHETAYQRAAEDVQTDLHSEREGIVKQVVDSGGRDPQEQRRAGPAEQRAAVEDARRAGSPHGAYREPGRPGAGSDAAPRGQREVGAGPDQGVRRLEPSPQLAAAFEKHGVPRLALNELPKSADSAAQFSAAISATKTGNKFGAAVFVYPNEEYAKMRLFLSDDGKTGFALKGDDIVSGFSTGGGAMNGMLQLAIQAGGRRLDCFDTVLPDIYSRHGFRIVSRQKWNDEYAPEGWDKATFSAFNKGEPDVVFMAYDPNYYGAPTAQDGGYAADYDAAVEMQKAAVERWSPAMPKFSVQAQRYDGRDVIEGPKREANFKKWFGKSVVVDDKGQPLRVYHGAVTTFDAFDKGKANPESNVGGGFYFTTSQKDANENYASLKGPDLTNKLDNLTRQLADERDLEHDEAARLAREMLADNHGIVMPMYLRMTKPVKIGVKPQDNTFFDFEVSPSGKTRGTLAPILKAIEEIADSEELDFNKDAVLQSVIGAALDGEGVRADELLHMMYNEYVQNDEGKFAGGELFRKALERAGYDGIIDTSVAKKFPAMGLDKGTTHYTVFHSTQIKSAIGNSGDFGKAEPGFMASPVAGTKAPPRSFRDMLQNPNRMLSTLRLDKESNAKSDIGEAIDAYVARKYGTISRTDFSTEAAEKIAAALTDEMLYQIETGKDKSGLGWYSQAYPDALKSLSEVFPELKDNRGARGLITALFAATSNGEQVDKNAANAIDLYKRYRSNFIQGAKGTMARTVPGARRGEAINKNLVKLNKLIEEMGFDELVDHLLEPNTVSALNVVAKALGEKTTGNYPAEAIVPQASIYFGPKIGAFYANLMGEEGYLTMDLWWTRTINRIRGTLRPVMDEAKRARMIERLGMNPKLSDEEIAASVLPIYNKIVGEKGLKGLTRDERPIKQFYDYYAGLVDAPLGASERRFMMEIASTIQDNLMARGKRLSIADIQAGLWYYEKRLFQSLKQKNIKVLSYADSIYSLLPELRKQAEATASRGRERPGVGVAGERGGEAGPGGVREAGEPAAAPEEEVAGDLYTGPLGKMREGIDAAIKSVGGRRGVKPGDYNMAALPTHLQDVFEQIAKTFGKKFQGFTLGAQAPERINGMILPNEPDTIYINVHSDRPHVAVAMHEMVHSMKRDAPELYAQLEKALRLKEGATIKYRHQRLQEHKTGQRMALSDLTEEMVADVMGDHAADPQFWNELATRLGDPSIFQKIVNWVKKVVASLTKNLRPFGMDAYVHDFEQMRDTLVDIAAQYAKNNTPERQAIRARIAAKIKEDAANEVSAWARAENFDKWFEGSKITTNGDWGGKALMMFHGTARRELDKEGKPVPIRTFTRGQAGSIFVTVDPLVAEHFGKQSEERVRKPAYYMPLYVHAANPFEYWNEDHLAAVRQGLQTNNPSLPKSELDKIMRAIKGGFWPDIESDLVQEVIREQGHDAYWMHEEGNRTLGVYSPGQLKSATGNDGNFSPTERSILKSVSERRSFADVTKPDSVRELAENLFGREMTAVMPLEAVDGGVLSMLQNDEVRRAVVASLPVDVVNILTGRQLSAEDVFSNADMVVPNLSADHLRAVARGLLRATRSVHARLRAELLAARNAGRDEQLLPALKASDLDAREVVGLLSPQLAYHDGAALDAEESPPARTTAEDTPGGLGRVKQRHLAPAALADFLNWHERIVGGTGDSYQASDLPLFSRQQIPSRAPVNAMPNELTWSPPVIGAKLGYEMPIQKMARMFVDKFNRVKQFQEWAAKRGATITDARDIYGKEMLFYGKAQRAFEQYTKDHVDPIAEAIKAAKLTMEEVDDYLWWSHAGERNATIAERNPEMPDGGSGITTQAAADALAALDPAKRNALEGVAQMVYRMNQQKQDMLLDEGLITQEEHDQLANRWTRYVPLKTINEDETGGGTGMGYDIRGKEYQMAMGRTSQPDSPLATSMSDYNRAIIRTQKSAVGKAVYELAKDPALQDVLRITNKDEYTIRYTNAQGQVTTGVDPNWQLRDEVYGTKIGGVPVFIHVSDPLMLQQLKKMGESEVGAFVEGVGKITGSLGRMFTQYNPAFAPVNLLRDTIAVAINASGLKGMSPGGIFAAMGPSLGAINAHLRDKTSDRATKVAGLTWGQAYKDFLDDGAQTGGMAMKSLADIQKDIEAKGVDLKTDLTSTEKMARNARRLKALGQPLLDALSHLNEWTENASRLSAYVRAREAGYSRHEAAKLAKEISVNFNKRGEYSRLLNSTFMFFNASVQGSRAFYKFVNNPITRNYMLGMMAMGVITELMGQMAGGDDDDNGEKNWFKVSEYKKDHNIVIPIGPGEFITIPLPYIYNLPYMFARRVTAAALRPADMGTHAVGIIAGIVDGLSPLGGFEDSPSAAASVGKLLTPSVLKPLMDLAVNADFQGRPIRKEANAMDKSPPPAAYSYFESATELSKAVTKFLNDYTGGNAVRPGLINISPNSVDYVVSYFSGGVGRILVQGEDFVQKALTGKLDDFDPNKLPIINRFASSESPYFTLGQYNEISKRLDYLRDESKNGLKPDDPLVKLVPQYVATDSRVRSLQKQAKALQAKGIDTDDPRIKRLRDQQDSLRDGLLKRVNIRLGYYDALRGTGSASAEDFRSAGYPATAELVSSLSPTSLQ